MGKALILIRLGGAVPSSSFFFISHHEALSTGNESSLTSQMENYTENNTYNPRPFYQQPCGPPKSPYQKASVPMQIPSFRQEELQTLSSSLSTPPSSFSHCIAQNDVAQESMPFLSDDEVYEELQKLRPNFDFAPDPTPFQPLMCRFTTGIGEYSNSNEILSSPSSWGNPSSDARRESQKQLASTEDPIQPQKVKRPHRRKPTTSKTLPLCQTIAQKPILKRKWASKQAEQSKEASGSSEWPKPSEFLNDAVEYYHKNGNLTGFLDSNNGKKVPLCLYITTKEGRSSVRFRFQNIGVSNGPNDGLILLLSFVTYLMNPASLNPDIISQLTDNLNKKELNSIFERLESFCHRVVQNEKMKTKMETKSSDWIGALKKIEELFKIEQDGLQPSLKKYLNEVVEYRNKNGNLTDYLPSKTGKLPRYLSIKKIHKYYYLRFRCQELEVQNASNDGMILLLSFLTYLMDSTSLNPHLISQPTDDLNKDDLNSTFDRLQVFCAKGYKDKDKSTVFKYTEALKKTKELFKIEKSIELPVFT